jgi:hypothetical protein
VDRRTKPTLARTIPRSLFKSSTKDLSLPIFEIVIEAATAARFVDNGVPAHLMILGPEAYFYSCNIGRGE